MSAKMKVATHLLNTSRVGQLVDLKSLDTNATVKEAIDKGYVVGKQDLVVSAVCGVLRSMAADISKDGNGRKIDCYVSIQPSVKCKLVDDCEPVSKDNVEASLRIGKRSRGRDCLNRVRAVRTVFDDNDVAKVLLQKARVRVALLPRS